MFSSYTITIGTHKLTWRSSDGKEFMKSLYENSPFVYGTFHQHVAVEEYLFETIDDALVFFKGTSALRHHIWQGAKGCYCFLGKQIVMFDKDGKL